MSKTNCRDCAYKGNVPGSAHIRCRFNFLKAKKEMPCGDSHGIRSGWYMFPLLYDPVWMAEECPAFSQTVDPALVLEEYDTLIELIARLR
jgi:hypothetical protein